MDFAKAIPKIDPSLTARAAGRAELPPARLRHTIADQAYTKGVQALHQTQAFAPQVNDPLEREADVTADTVMRADGGVGPAKARNVPRESSGTPLSPGSGGSPISGGIRTSMEERFAADFSGVRLHSGSEATRLARTMQARAFTRGQDIYFGEGQSSFHTLAGERLLAHELTHTLQQTRPGATPFRVQRQAQSKEELQKRLAAVQKDLSVGSGVRSPEATAELKHEEESLQVALKQVSADDLRQKLDANRKQQAAGSGVRSPEASEKLKVEEQELAMRLAIASGSSTAAANVIRPTPGQPFINWQGGNLRGLSAETGVLARHYPTATPLPKNFPAVDFIEGGTRTPLTGFGRGATGKLPLSPDSEIIDGGTLIQLKTLKNNTSPSYQEPNKLYSELNEGMKKLANFKPGTGRSERVGAEYRRVEHTGTAERKILHVELEAPPTADQLGQIEKLRDSGKLWGPGEEIEVIVNWPGSGPKPSSKVTPEGVSGGVAVGVAVVGMIGREAQRERQFERGGYAPIGPAAHQGDNLAVRLGAFLRGDPAEMFGSPSMPNIPVWRNNIRQKANAKTPGQTLGFTWQYKDLDAVLSITRDVNVTYQKQQNGSWKTINVEERPKGFSAPDLDQLIDPGVSDEFVKNMISGRTSA